jgi:hypothetical protein
LYIQDNQGILFYECSLKILKLYGMLKRELRSLVNNRAIEGGHFAREQAWIQMGEAVLDVKECREVLI